MAAFHRAERQRVPMKIALTGPSGSGKTYGALLLAFGLSDKGRIAVIDTENDSANLYAHLGAYDVLTIHPPFTVQKYIDAIDTAIGEKYDVLVIDSLTHAWAGEGGLLQKKEWLDARGGNSFSNWAGITKEHEALKSHIVQAPIHVIATMRSKQDYVLVESEKGKQTPRKVGLAPIQREGMEYEFMLVLDCAMDHSAVASKDRTGLFDGRIERITPDTGTRIAAWLEGASPVGAVSTTAQALGGDSASRAAETTAVAASAVRGDAEAGSRAGFHAAGEADPHMRKLLERFEKLVRTAHSMGLPDGEIPALSDQPSEKEVLAAGKALSERVKGKVAA